jgi:hypothetical protein
MAASTAVVNTGRAIITSRLIGTATAVPLYVAWGTGTAAVTLTDTTLTEPGEARTLGIGTQTTTTTTSDTMNVTGTVVATGTRTIGEAGLFTALTSGTLFVRGVLANTIGLSTNDSVAFTFNVSITSAVV